VVGVLAKLTPSPPYVNASSGVPGKKLNSVVELGPWLNSEEVQLPGVAAVSNSEFELLVFVPIRIADPHAPWRFRAISATIIELQ
jgi:hypothetical protein